jgi:hypothetical protein
MPDRLCALKKAKSVQQEVVRLFGQGDGDAVELLGDDELTAQARCAREAEGEVTVMPSSSSEMMS